MIEWFIGHEMYERYGGLEWYAQVVVLVGAMCVLAALVCLVEFLVAWIRGQLWVRKQRREHR